MKNSKTRSLVALMFVFCFMLTTACSGQKIEDAPVSSDSSEPSKSSLPFDVLTIYTDGTPGSSGDSTVRLLGEIIEKQTSHTVVIENVPGGSGTNVMTAIMTNKKGVNIVEHTCSLLISMAAGTSPYAFEDVVPVTSYGIDYIAILTRPESQFKTLDDIIEYAKANPGQLNWGGTGVIGSQQLFFQLVMDEVGELDVNYIPYDSSSNVKVAILAGDIDVGTSTFGNVMADVLEGVYRCIIVSCPYKVEGAEDIPILADWGITGPANGNGVWRGFFCPSSYDEDLVEYISELIENAKQTDEWEEHLKTRHLERWDLGHQGFKDYVVEYMEAIKEPIEKIKARVQ